jgi:hypothetical protein
MCVPILSGLIYHKVNLSYDRRASFLRPYGNEEALRVAEDLDTKVEALLTAAAL